MKLGYSMRLAMRHKHHHSFASSRAHTHLGETSNRADALPCIARMRWIKSPAWDLVWVLNTVWLAPLVFLLGLGHDDVRDSPVDWLFFVLAVPLWFGHRVVGLAGLRHACLPPPARDAAAALRSSPVGNRRRLLRRAARARERATDAADRARGLPRCPGLSSGEPPFATQHFGLLSLYRARAGRSSDANARRLDRWFALVVGGGFVVLANALAGSIAFQDRWIDPLLGEALSDTVARTLRDGSMVVVVTITALMLRVELRSQRPSPPRVAYVVGVSAIVLFGFLNPFLFLVLWSVQHWSAAMGLASLAASGGVQATGAHWQRLLAPINRRGWAVLLVLAVVSTLLLPVLEVEAVTDEYAYADRIFGEAALWLRSSSFVPALLALGFATSFIHYVLDRAAFRFSSPDVRQAARGLLK